MADESYSFSTARTRLEEIVTQVRKKDTSLEKSLDLLEEGVRLANACTELIDHQDWVGPAVEEAEGSELVTEGSDTAGAEGAAGVDVVTVVEDIVIEGDDGNIVAEVIEVREFNGADAFDSADDAWIDESVSDATEDSDDPSAAER
jgi:exodeoxyribonuclease VII small subunit